MNKFLLIISLSCTMLTAKTIGIGSEVNMLNDFKYETPKGREMRVPKKPKLIVVAFEQETGALVNDYLKTKEPLYMTRNRSIFVADISKMPTIITNTFALPKMRKYNHLVYLHYNDEFQKVLPMKKDKLTLLHVEDSKIKNISFISTVDELKTAIEN